MKKKNAEAEVARLQKLKDQEDKKKLA